MAEMFRSTLPTCSALLILGSLSLVACRDGGQDGSKREPKAKATANTGPGETPTTKARVPKLVVAVVIDQLSSEALATYAPYLSKEGAIRRAMDGGLYAEQVHYDYAGTNTAPGHAAIFTGELPKDHGVDSNDLYDYQVGGKVSIVFDHEHAIFGSKDETAGPKRLLKPTVGDVLRAANDKSQVVAVSLKARAAVVMGGKNATAAIWYEEDSGGFTTSTYYSPEMPAWLSEWNAANPVDARLSEWSTDRGELYAKIIGPDDASGEADWYQLGTTFPHDLAKTLKPRKTFVASPQSAQYLCDLAGAAANHFDLGVDDNPDLLAISISSTDYAGHSYSWKSWEFADVLYKSDLALGALIRELEKNTDIAVIITSDHGGTPLPESLLARGLQAGRIDSLGFAAKLETRADKKLGKGNWIQAYIQPYLWLHADAKTSKKRAQLEALITEMAAAEPGVRMAVPASVARTWAESKDDLEREVANTVAPITDAVFVVPAEGYIASPGPGDLGTGHGTPWSWDRDVPVLAFGVGVEHNHQDQQLAQNRVAPTIAALLGISWPTPAQPLPGITTPADKEPQ